MNRAASPFFAGPTSLVTLLAAALVSLATPSPAACPPSCPIPGGEELRYDCHSEFASDLWRLNYPFAGQTRHRVADQHRCFDGEVGCDLDGEVDGACTFDIDVCLRNDDPAIPECTAADVTDFRVRRTSRFPGIEALGLAAQALLPATSNVCTEGQTFRLPVKGPDADGLFRRARRKIKLEALTATGLDRDALTVLCIPRRWPTHGYDDANRAGSTFEQTIHAGNVAQLTELWTFRTETPVTATPTADRKRVFATDGDGWVYGLNRRNGRVRWRFDTGARAPAGVSASVAVTSYVRVLLADGNGDTYCLNAKKGQFQWQSPAVWWNDPDGAHIFATPRIMNGRFFVGRDGHDDGPCTDGFVFAVDVDDGAEIWRYKTIPDNVCYADTATECSREEDCPAGGSPCRTGFCARDSERACTADPDCMAVHDFGPCVTDSRCVFSIGQACSADIDCPSCVVPTGGGVRATVASDPTGETVYVATVGCEKTAAVGNSEAVIALDTRTGAERWVYRPRAPEAYTAGPPYRRYGYLEGPMLVRAPDGAGGERSLLIAGGTDGTLTALSPDTGAVVWSRAVFPEPANAGDGVFHGAPAYAEGAIFAAVNTGAVRASGTDDLYAFSAIDGSTLWSQPLGGSLSDVTVAGGVVFVGNSTAPTLFALDAATGNRLIDLPMPEPVVGGVSIVGNRLFAPYGHGAASGGVRAFELP